MNAAATDGVKLTAGTNQKLLGTEVTHTAPVPQTNGAVEFTFTVQAPNVNGPMKLWAAGNAVDGDGTKAGDLAATTSITINISGATAAAPDAGSATTPVSGGDASVASTSTGANASNARAPGADGGAVPFYLTGADQGDKPEFADTGMSCSVGNGAARSPLAFVFGLGLAIAALVSRRRRS
jgi:MYXO-CTERM domain-containing protein